MKSLFFLILSFSVASQAGLVANEDQEKYLRALDMALPHFIHCQDTASYPIQSQELKHNYVLETISLLDEQTQPVIQVKWSAKKMDNKFEGQVLQVHTFTTDKKIEKILSVKVEFFDLKWVNVGSLIKPEFQPAAVLKKRSFCSLRR